MDPRSLFPSLPPEIRNLIYSHTISTDHPITNTHLPLRCKSYTSSHTTIEVTPLHHGNPGLLALRKFRFTEGAEYESWLLNHAIQLRISVLFKGHVHTFVQEHWEKKIAAQLGKLVREYAWVGRAAEYDVRITWAPVAWGQGKKRKGIGAIAGRMVHVLTGEMDGEVKRKWGVVMARLHVAESVACNYGLRGQELGLRDFVWGADESVRMQVREVGIARDAVEAGRGGLPSRFEVIPGTTTGKRLAGWEDGTKRIPVFRREISAGHEETKRCGTSEDSEGAFVAISGEIARAVEG